MRRISVAGSVMKDNVLCGKVIVELGRFIWKGGNG